MLITESLGLLVCTYLVDDSNYPVIEVLVALTPKLSAFFFLQYPLVTLTFPFLKFFALVDVLFELFIVFD